MKNNFRTFAQTTKGEKEGAGCFNLGSNLKPLRSAHTQRMETSPQTQTSTAWQGSVPLASDALVDRLTEEADGGFLGDKEVLQRAGVDHELEVQEPDSPRQRGAWSVRPQKNPPSNANESALQPQTRATLRVPSMNTMLGGSRVEAKRQIQRDKLNRSMVVAQSSTPDLKSIAFDDESLPGPYEDFKKVFIP